jgi:hypothetical protein
LQVTATAFANIGWKFYLVSFLLSSSNPRKHTFNSLQVFIIVCGLGAILMFILLPETKGVPLEEIAKLFGDTESVMVYAADIHVDHATHEVEVSGKDGLTHVATDVNETAVGPTAEKHQDVRHTEQV